MYFAKQILIFYLCNKFLENSHLVTCLFGTILLFETQEKKDLVITKVNLTFIIVV